MTRAARRAERVVVVCVGAALVASLAGVGAPRSVAQDAPPLPSAPSLARRALAPAVPRPALPARWPRQPVGEPGAGPTADEALALAFARAARGALGIADRPASGDDASGEHADAGRGATVCVVDTGVDVSHRALRTPDGRTRVAWLWDRASAPRARPPRSPPAPSGPPAPPGPPPPPDWPEDVRSSGALWSAEELDRALALGDPALPRDRHGHGTAMASLAAGAVIGLAPAATLLVARAYDDTLGGFRDEDLWLAARFCVAASADPRRTVILLALGGHDGTHDADDPLGRALASLPALVVAAAGNDGERAVHAQLWLGAPSGSGTPGAGTRGSGAASDGGGGALWTDAVTLRVPSPGGPDGVLPRHVALAVATEGDVALQLVGPDGSATPWVGRGESADETTAAGALVLAAADGVTRGAALHYAVVGDAAPRGVLGGLDAGVGGDAGAPAPSFVGGRYVLRARGRGRVDVWLAGAHLPGAFLPPTLEGPHVVSEGTVRIPATSPGVLSVGAAAPAAGAPACAAAACAPPPPGAVVARTSSRGPARDGAPKPELVAPGQGLLAALSADVRAGEPNLFGGSAARLRDARVGADLFWIEGSSPAAALAAGALARALARAPLPDEGAAPVSRCARALRARAPALEEPAVPDPVAPDPAPPSIAPPPLARADAVVAAVATARRLSAAAWDPVAGAGMLDVAALERALAAGARRSRGAGGGHDHAVPVVLDPSRSRAAPTRFALPPGAGSVLLFVRLAALDPHARAVASDAPPGPPLPDGVRVEARLVRAGSTPPGVAAAATDEATSCDGIALLGIPLPPDLPPGEHRVRLTALDAPGGTALGDVVFQLDDAPAPAPGATTGVHGGGCGVATPGAASAAPAGPPAGRACLAALLAALAAAWLGASRVWRARAGRRLRTPCPAPAPDPAR
jgi:hypothetical protein